VTFSAMFVPLHDSLPVCQRMLRLRPAPSRAGSALHIAADARPVEEGEQPLRPRGNQGSILALQDAVKKRVGRRFKPRFGDLCFCRADFSTWANWAGRRPMAQGSCGSDTRVGSTPLPPAQAAQPLGNERAPGPWGSANAIRFREPERLADAPIENRSSSFDTETSVSVGFSSFGRPTEQRPV
jgi:hypothetical protein